MMIITLVNHYCQVYHYFFFPLGEYATLNVMVTISRSVIFTVTYFVPPLHPVRLRLGYEEVGGDRSDFMTPITQYLGQKIIYIADAGDLPYERFTVNISLYSDGALGPVGDDTRTIGEMRRYTNANLSGKF